MQIRSSTIHGLEPADDDKPAIWIGVSVFAAVALTLILVAVYLLGARPALVDGHGNRIHYAPVDRSPFAPPAGALADIVPPQVFAAVTPEQAVIINAGIPVSLEPNPAAKPFRLAAVNPVDQIRAQTCLTMAVYYEAASQGDVGEAAVAQVVLNRVRNPVFPKTVCGVVFQGSTLPTGCQFTFTCDGSLNRKPDPIGWKRASQIASLALSGYVEPLVGEATHYHTIWVVPSWQSTVDKVAQIGAHIFYRWRGALGQPRAFSDGGYAGAEPLPTNVQGFDFGQITVVSPDAVAVTPVVADREPMPVAPRSIVEAPQSAPPGAHQAAVSLSAPLLPDRLETPPSVLHVDNPQRDLQSNHRLAMPSSW
jgi:hypothetical protein